MEMKEEIVEIVRSPESPHLVGKQGVVVHREGNYVCVRIGNGYTHFHKKEVKAVKSP